MNDDILKNFLDDENVIIFKILTKIMQLVFIIFSIISVVYVGYSESIMLCENSNIWLYVIIQFFINDFISEYKNGMYEKNNVLILKLHTLFSIMYFLWGIVEINLKCTNKLHETWLYTMACITTLYHGIMIFINIFVYCYNCYCSYISDIASNNSNNVNNTTNNTTNTTNTTNNTNNTTNNTNNTNVEKIPLPPFVNDFLSYYLPKPVHKKNNTQQLVVNSNNV